MVSVIQTKIKPRHLISSCSTMAHVFLQTQHENSATCHAPAKIRPRRLLLGMLVAAIIISNLVAFSFFFRLLTILPHDSANGTLRALHTFEERIFSKPAPTTSTGISNPSAVSPGIKAPSEERGHMLSFKEFFVVHRADDLTTEAVQASYRRYLFEYLHGVLMTPTDSTSGRKALVAGTHILGGSSNAASVPLPPGSLLTLPSSMAHGSEAGASSSNMLAGEGELEEHHTGFLKMCGDVPCPIPPPPPLVVYPHPESIKQTDWPVWWFAPFFDKTSFGKEAANLVLGMIRCFVPPSHVCIKHMFPLYTSSTRACIHTSLWDHHQNKSNPQQGSVRSGGRHLSGTLYVCHGGTCTVAKRGMML